MPRIIKCVACVYLKLLVKISGGSKGAGGRGPLLDYWPPVTPRPPTPSDNCVIRLASAVKIVELLYLYIGINFFDFAQALTTVIEELVNGESGIVTDVLEAQTTYKLSRRRT